MDNNSNQGEIYQGFLDTFCIRADQIPLPFSDSDNWDAFKLYYSTDELKQEMIYITHEGYINFNVNGITYVSRDCEDVRTYLESLGYKKEEKFIALCVMAAWYNISKMRSIYPIDSHIFRLFFGLSFADKSSPTLVSGKIGKNEVEIKQSIEKAKREDPIFNDELWLKSNYRKQCQIMKDEEYYRIARQYIMECIENIGYKNVYIPEILNNKEDIVKIINYYRMAKGNEPDYVLSDAYITELIPKLIKKREEEEKGITFKNNANYKIFINTDESSLEDIKMFCGPNAICHSEEELWESLYSLLGNAKTK